MWPSPNPLPIINGSAIQQCPFSFFDCNVTMAIVTQSATYLPALPIFFHVYAAICRLPWSVYYSLIWFRWLTSMFWRHSPRYTISFSIVHLSWCSHESWWLATWLKNQSYQSHSRDTACILWSDPSVITSTLGHLPSGDYQLLSAILPLGPSKTIPMGIRRIQGHWYFSSVRPQTLPTILLAWIIPGTGTRIMIYLKLRYNGTTYPLLHLVCIPDFKPLHFCIAKRAGDNIFWTASNLESLSRTQRLFIMVCMTPALWSWTPPCPCTVHCDMLIPACHLGQSMIAGRRREHYAQGSLHNVCRVR